MRMDSSAKGERVLRSCGGIVIEVVNLDGEKVKQRWEYSQKDSFVYQPKGIMQKREGSKREKNRRGRRTALPARGEGERGVQGIS